MGLYCAVYNFRELRTNLGSNNRTNTSNLTHIATLIGTLHVVKTINTTTHTTTHHTLLIAISSLAVELDSRTRCAKSNKKNGMDSFCKTTST